MASKDWIAQEWKVNFLGIERDVTGWACPHCGWRVGRVERPYWCESCGWIKGADVHTREWRESVRKNMRSVDYGPWESQKINKWMDVTGPHGGPLAYVLDTESQHANSAHIINMDPTNTEALFEYVDELEAKVAELETALKDHGVNGKKEDE